MNNLKLPLNSMRRFKQFSRRFFSHHIPLHNRSRMDFHKKRWIWLTMPKLNLQYKMKTYLKNEARASWIIFRKQKTHHQIECLCHLWIDMLDKKQFAEMPAKCEFIVALNECKLCFYSVELQLLNVPETFRSHLIMWFIKLSPIKHT